MKLAGTQLHMPKAVSMVAVKASAIHGLGLFAQEAVARGTRVIEYVGERISKQESLERCARNNHFIFCLDEQVDLDGSVEWNPARFANHSCEPNCDMVKQDGRLWLEARQDIVAGAELTFNYGYDLEDYRNYPCHCGSPRCVGFIVNEAFFDHVRQCNP